MVLSNQQNFLSDLDGTNVNELNRKIDYDKSSLEDRREVINDILHDTNFYEEYFEDQYTANINKETELTENNNVCQSLESMANYLLNSQEVKDEDKKNKPVYVFYKNSKRFKNRVNKQQSLAFGQSESDEENVIHFLKREQGNYKKQKIQSIKAEDFKRDGKVGEVLRSYNGYLQALKKDEHMGNYKKSSINGSVKQDMIYSKDALLGVFGYKPKYLSESTEIDFDVFDFTNIIHLKGTTLETEKGHRMFAEGLLFFEPYFEADDDFSVILTDLQKTIEQAGLTEDEWFVLDSVRKGMTHEEVSAHMDYPRRKVTRIVDRIAKKVIRVGNKYDGLPDEKEDAA